QPRFLRERPQHRADVLEVIRTCASDGMTEVGRLEQHVDERAALEVVTVEPLVEEVEDREQPSLRRRSAAPRLHLDPAVRPDLLALAEELEHELVLRR